MSVWRSSVELGPGNNFFLTNASKKQRHPVSDAECSSRRSQIRCWEDVVRSCGPRLTTACTAFRTGTAATTAAATARAAPATTIEEAPLGYAPHISCNSSCYEGARKIATTLPSTNLEVLGPVTRELGHVKNEHDFSVARSGSSWLFVAFLSFSVARQWLFEKRTVARSGSQCVIGKRNVDI